MLIVTRLSHDCHKTVTKVCYPMLHNLITQKEKRMEEWKQQEFDFNEWQEEDFESFEDLTDIIVNGKINIANDWLEFKN